MATNPKFATPIDVVTKQQLDNLADGNTITKGDNSLTADESRLYLIPDDSVVVTNTAPTSSTVGYVGQLRLISTAGSEALYICTVASSTYTWKQITLT